MQCIAATVSCSSSLCGREHQCEAAGEAGCGVPRQLHQGRHGLPRLRRQRRGGQLRRQGQGEDARSQSLLSLGCGAHTLTPDAPLRACQICHTEGYHCRGESWPFCQHGYYTEAPLWATYSHLLWQLTFGVDLPGLSEPNLVNESYAPLYELFNRYAGSIRPPADDW